MLSTQSVQLLHRLRESDTAANISHSQCEFYLNLRMTPRIACSVTVILQEIITFKKLPGKPENGTFSAFLAARTMLFQIACNNSLSS